MAANTDLIPALCEDVVLGEVVPELCRLPWNERPLLVMINRSWYKAIAERFQMYHQGLHKPPNILSKALIISHVKQTSNQAHMVMLSYVLLSLWVCRPSNISDRTTVLQRALWPSVFVETTLSKMSHLRVYSWKV